VGGISFGINQFDSIVNCDAHRPDRRRGQCWIQGFVHTGVPLDAFASVGTDLYDLDAANPRPSCQSPLRLLYRPL